MFDYSVQFVPYLGTETLMIMNATLGGDAMLTAYLNAIFGNTLFIVVYSTTRKILGAFSFRCATKHFNAVRPTNQHSGNFDDT